MLQALANWVLSRDRRVATVLFLSALCLGIWGLGALEFFRHTEADRSLIAWEMHTRGDYLVPHLLGSVILTKPPIYYWFVAASIALFGHVSEFVVRVPSAVASAFMILSQFLFLRASGCSRAFAALSAFLLFTCAEFFVLASVAEIDMCYALFTSMALFLGYFIFGRRPLLASCAAWAVAGIAFLIKGPPAAVFLALAQFLFFCARDASVMQLETKQKLSWLRFIAINFVGVLIFFILVGAWLVSLANVVGWQELWGQFRVEIFERFLYDTRRARGPFFYLEDFFGSAAPWSLFVLPLAFLFWKRRGELCRLEAPPALLTYHLFAVLGGAGVLALAAGKSPRYMFPLFPSVAVLLAWLVSVVWHSSLQRSIRFSSRAFLFLLALASLASTVLISWKASTAQFVLILVALTGFWLVRELGRASGAVLCCLLVVFTGTLRLAYAHVYAPLRNESRSVRGVVDEIVANLPQGEVLYTVETFDRWLAFYLKLRGHEVLRLTPEIVSKLSAQSGKVFLLLNKREEEWRTQQMQHYDPLFHVVATLGNDHGEHLLAVTSMSTLDYLDVWEVFPTTPSPPYYAEAAACGDRVTSKTLLSTLGRLGN